MPNVQVRCTVLEDRGDERGRSYSPGPQWLTFLGGIADSHITTILPGHVRGNHFHAERNEVLIVGFSDEWELFWDLGPGTARESRRFSGSGVVVVEITAGASHALRNCGASTMWVAGFSNGTWDPAHPDSFARLLIADPRTRDS